MTVMCLSFCILCCGSADAHTMWLNCTDFYTNLHPGHGGHTKVYFGWGHRYPVDGFMTDEFLGELALLDPNGKKMVLTPGEGGFRATELTVDSNGGWIATASLKPGFYTMYMDKGRMHHKIGPKTGLENVLVSLYYEQYTKALITVGDVKAESFLKPVGHKIEIIPLKNPATLREGDILPVQVLFEGRPVRYCGVVATYTGFSTGEEFAYATETDGRGRAEIRLLHYGNWLIKAEQTLPASEALKDKCDELHYTASLTFEIK